jgi:hypothetical protein
MAAQPRVTESNDPTELAGQNSSKAATLLFFGGAAYSLGFVVVSIMGVCEFFGLHENPVFSRPGAPFEYPSGHGYWPGTVSELAHQRDSAGGRIFHTFGMIAGLCLFLSWYPVHLSNVNTFEDLVHMFPLPTNVCWTTFRQVVPTMGLFLVIGIGTYPNKVARGSVAYLKGLCNIMHWSGAGMLFIGYAVCEMKCLGMLGFTQHRCVKKALEEKKEQALHRRLAVYVLVLAFSGMVVCQVLIGCSTLKHVPFEIPTGDKWKNVGDRVVDVKRQVVIAEKEPQIVDTASGPFLCLKIASFVLEDIAGIAFVYSHLAVWFYCRERHNSHHKLVGRLEQVARLSTEKAGVLLFFGACTCISGFVLLTLVGFLQYFYDVSNEALAEPLDKEFKSGHGYWPSTVSEMVHERDSAAGRLFFTLGMITVVSIFQSWYPVHLSNVNTREHQVPYFPVEWATVRQVVPMMGLLVLIGINTYPMQEAKASVGKTKLFSVMLHLVGAGMLFLGYTLCEMKCLGIWPFSLHPTLTAYFDRDENKREFTIRQRVVIVIGIFFVLFSCCQVVMFVSPKGLLPTADYWIKVGEPGNKSQEPQIANTASGWYLIVKIASFVFEDIAGITMVTSHLFIWYFSDERTAKDSHVTDLRQISNSVTVRQSAPSASELRIAPQA